MTQHSAEGFFKVRLGKRCFHGPGRENGAIDEDDLIAEIRNTSKIVGGNQN